MAVHHGGKVGKAGKTLASKSSSKSAKSKAGKTLANHKVKRINGKVPMQPHRHLILFVMQIYSPMTSNIILAPSLNPFLKIKQSVLV